MLLLFDIGNTNTHVGLADARRLLRQTDLPTAGWATAKAMGQLRKFVGRSQVSGAAICSVVPRATPKVRATVSALWKLPAKVTLSPLQTTRLTKPALRVRGVEGGEGQIILELTPATLRGVGIDYPKPNSIGPDRLANAVAARKSFGAPVVVVDFGTAVTFDVVNARGDYVGGVIAPGLAAMTDYLHEKTALLPRIAMRDVKSAIGKSTEHAMLAGAVLGYRGLVRELIQRLRRELRATRLPVVATGGYAKLIARGLPEISRVVPGLTLEGLRLVWLAHQRERR